MMISDEQAMAAASYLRTSPFLRGRVAHPEISPAILAAARAIVETTPEMRSDLVAEAIDHLGEGNPDSRDVASKIISRCISDSLR